MVPATPLAHAYQSEHRRSLENPAAFWADKATHIEWFQPPPAATVLTRDANGIHRWFKGGSLNAAYLATEMPARTRGSQAALIYDSPVTGQKRTLLYSELDEQVGRMAHVLKTEFGIVC